MEPMVGCRVQIVTDSEGSRNSVERPARCETLGDGSLRVCYREEGDEAMLLVANTYLRMERRGETGCSALFTEGEKTEFLLSLPGGTGAIPVVTARYSSVFSASGAQISLDYSLEFPDGPKQFHLILSIRNISEAK